MDEKRKEDDHLHDEAENEIRFGGGVSVSRGSGRAVFGEKAPIGFVVLSVSGMKVAAFGHSPKEAAESVAHLLEEPVELVERAEDLDVFSPGPAPISQMVELLGYSFSCLHCDAVVDEDLFDYRDNRKLNPVYDDESQVVFCSPECVLKYDKAQRLKFH